MHKIYLSASGEDTSRLWELLQREGFADPEVSLSQEGGKPAPGTFALSGFEIAAVVGSVAALVRALRPLFERVRPKTVLILENKKTGAKVTITTDSSAEQTSSACERVLNADQRPGGSNLPQLPPP